MPEEKGYASSRERRKSSQRFVTHQHSVAGPSQAAQYLHRNATVLNKLQELGSRVKVEVIRDRRGMQARSITLREFSQMKDTSNWASKQSILIVRRCSTLTSLTIWLIMQAICNSLWVSSKMTKSNSLISDRSERRHRNVRARKIAAIQKITHEFQPWIKQSTSWAINKTSWPLLMVTRTMVVGLVQLLQMQMNQASLSLSKLVIMVKVKSAIRAGEHNYPHKSCQIKSILLISKRIRLWLTIIWHQTINYHQKTRPMTSRNQLTSVPLLLQKCHSSAMVLLMEALSRTEEV